MEECFSLSQWPFYLAYVDDDGEEYPIKTEADLTEAIAYFVSGDDDHSIRTGSEGVGARLAHPAPKITMRVDVVVEYDGPSLSDTSSIASLSLSSENSWSSGLTRSSAASGSVGGSFITRDSYGADSASLASRDGPDVNTSYRANAAAAASATSLGHRFNVLDRTYSPGFPEPPTDSLAAIRLSNPATGHFHIPPPAELDPSARRRPMLSPHSASSAQNLLRPSSSGSSPSAVSPISPISPSETTMPLKDGPPLPPPSLLSQSELGSLWLREQSQLASRVPLRAVRRYDSDNESLSDEEDIGDIALVRDERGRAFLNMALADVQDTTTRTRARMQRRSGRGMSVIAHPRRRPRRRAAGHIPASRRRAAPPSPHPERLRPVTGRTVPQSSRPTARHAACASTTCAMYAPRAARVTCGPSTPSRPPSSPA